MQYCGVDHGARATLPRWGYSRDEWLAERPAHCVYSRERAMKTADFRMSDMTGGKHGEARLRLSVEVLRRAVTAW